MKNLKPIETIYRGYRFRSRLEARWAVFFDAMGIEWRYEEQGFELSDGSRYLPDFYLPESNTFFEVKGAWTDGSRSKVDLLLKAGCRVAVGYEVGVFQATDNWWDECYSLAEVDNGCLAQCRKCGKYWFMGLSGSMACPCCGAYDGDHCYRFVARSGDLTDAVKTARSARFEHGESPEVK